MAASGSTSVLSDWASALAQLPDVGAQKAARLAQLCSTSAASNSSDVVHQMLPLIDFISKFRGQHPPEVLQQLGELIEHLPAVWIQSEPDPPSCQELHSRVLKSLQTLIHDDASVPSTTKSGLSAAFGRLLLVFLAQQFGRDPDGALPHAAALKLGPKTGAYAFFRAVARSEASANRKALPLLGIEAWSLLIWVDKEVMANISPDILPAGHGVGAMNGSGKEHDGRQPSDARSSATATLLGDDKFILLLNRLLVTALVETGAEPLSHTHAQRLVRLAQLGCGVLQAGLHQLLVEDDESKGGAGAAQLDVQLSGGVTLAAAMLSATALHSLLEQGHGDPQLLEQVQGQLFAVLDLVLKVAEGCVEAASGMGTDSGADEVLELAGCMLGEVLPLMVAYASTSPVASSLVARLHMVQMGTARLVQEQGGVTKPARKGSIGLKLGAPSSPSLSVGTGRSLTDTPGTMRRTRRRSLLSIANPWRWDVTEPLATLEEEHDHVSPGQGLSYMCRMVTETLCQAAAAGWAAGHQQAARLLLQLPDSFPTPPEQLVAVLTLGRLLVLAKCEESVAKLVVPLVADSLLSGRGAATGPVYSTMLWTLACTAGAATHLGSAASWCFTQTSELLIKLYTTSTADVWRKVMISSPESRAGGAPGALAAALHRLALGASTGPNHLRTQLRQQLLELFSTCAMDAAGDNRVKDVEALLPALAEACSGMEPSTQHGTMQSMQGVPSSRSTRLRPDVMQRWQMQDAALIKLFRNFWLYCAIFKFTDSTAQAGMLAAAGRIAAATPVLQLVGAGPHDKQDLKDRLSAEIGNRVARAGKGATPAALTAGLLQAVGASPAVLPPPSDPLVTAYLWAVATAEICRVTCASLSVMVEASPLAPIHAYLLTPSAGSTEAAWYRAIAEKAFNDYAIRCTRLRTYGPGTVFGDYHADDRLHAEAATVALAVELIRSLGNASSGHAENKEPLVVQVADAQLRDLLSKAPSLLWSHDSMSALLGMLEGEEGDTPLGQLPARGMAPVSGGASPVWDTIRSWVEMAARLAPSHTEATLHMFLGRLSNAASAAALRRAADLLGICAAARASSHVGHSTPAAEGMAALSRKQYYLGAVTSLEEEAEESGAVSVAVGALYSQLADQLAAAVAQQLPMKVLEQRYLQCAALLASGLRQASSGPVQRLLAALCTAPQQRFTPEMLGLAVFAWTWVGTTAPDLYLALMMEVEAAWTGTVERRQGLFGGQDHALEGADPAAAVDGLVSHSLWLAFLVEVWAVVKDRCGEVQEGVSRALQRLLHHSLATPQLLSSHGAAVTPRFRLLALALRVVSGEFAALPRLTPPPPTLVLLYDRVLMAALHWFSQPTPWYGNLTRSQAEEQHAAVRDFLAQLRGMDTAFETTSPQPALLFPAAAAPTSPVVTLSSSETGLQGAGAVDLASPGGVALRAVWRAAGRGSSRRTADLLVLLCRHEVERLQVWARPLDLANKGAESVLPPALPQWRELISLAWELSPKLAIAMLSRCPTSVDARQQLEALVVKNAGNEELQQDPEAALLLAGCGDKNPTALSTLSQWAPAGAVQGLQLIAGPTGRFAAVKAYAIRCLHTAAPEKVAFFLPQLVQCLRRDTDGTLTTFLMEDAARNHLFCHRLIWALQTEEEPPKEAFNPEVKRSGWEPPKDYGLWKVAGQVRNRVLKGLPQEVLEYWEAENGYFEAVTAISGVLKPLSPDARRARIHELLRQIELPRRDLYLPTTPDAVVESAIASSGTPMPSAAKVPILVAFQVQGPDEHHPHVSVSRTQALIFKVGDDVRQDVLALQVISILRDAFVQAGLDLYLCPYGVIPTGYERGVIQVVPNTKSRSAVGEITEGGLFEYFQILFGAPGSAKFEQARHNFIISEAGYAIASFLLQCKDRHNGNLLIDSEGHLVHIDFGFILEISPGGNMKFESAAFKLSHEMTQLLDPSGERNSAHFRLFEELCIRGYLVARSVAEPILASVALMAESGLPCFGRGAPLANLRKRFRLELSERQAAAYMRELIADSYAKWSTGGYDYIQYISHHHLF